MSGFARGFQSGTDDGSHLETIIEVCEGGSATKRSTITEEDVKEAKAKYESVASSAKREMREMCKLLKKLETGTATKEERDRMVSLKGRLSRMKKEVKETKHAATTAERKMLLESTREKEAEVAKAIKKKGIERVIRSVRAAERVDIAFIVDCTGSMAPHIKSVKKNISNIVRQVMSTNGNFKTRLAFVCYRDFCDGQNQYEILDFVSSVKEFEGFVGNLRAIGGGDAPEDMAGGVKKANGLSWKYPTRVAFIIADAPCHGTKFHSYHDDHPSGSPGIDIISELNTLSGKNGSGSMSVYFGRITKMTEEMLGRFKSKGVNLQVFDLQDAAELTAAVTSSIRKSIFKTMTLTGGSTRSVPFDSIDPYKKCSIVILKDYRILARKPSMEEWRGEEVTAVQVFRNKPVKSISALRSSVAVGKVKKAPGRTDEVGISTMFMRRAAEPFAEGQIRIAFHGQLASKEGLLSLPKSEMILKSYKHLGKGLNDRGRYLKQMEVSNIVHFLATEYNRSKHRPRHCATIQCLQNCVIEETSKSNEKSGNRRFCAEAPLPIPAGAEFTKYSNNTGYWNDDEIDETLLRFTNYTYKITGKYLMVTDLQGVKVGNVYYLTDPVILCQEILRFGSTNLGPDFMKNCIDATHAHMANNGWKF